MITYIRFLLACLMLPTMLQASTIRLKDLVEFERQCCSELAWNLEYDSDAEKIRLLVTGIDPHSAFFSNNQTTLSKHQHTSANFSCC